MDRDSRSQSSRILLAVFAVVCATAATSMVGSPAEASILVDDDVTATVGELMVFRADVTESDLEFESVPPGAFASNSGRVVIWRPQAEALGRHEIVYRISTAGASEQRTVAVNVHHQRSPGLVMAMGDSIASGQGLELLDHLGLAERYRDAEPDGAWGRRVYDVLAARGEASSFAMVACGGARTYDLWEDPVSGGPADRSQTEISQLEWVVRSNPDLVLLTIGANDLKFDNPTAFFTNGVFDHDLAASRVASLQAGVEYLLESMVDQTEAKVVITTVHNPTSLTPHGVDGCRQRCFYDVTAEVVDMVRTAISNAAEPYADRVLVVDVADAMAGHGAPNGRGPDAFRAGNGWLASRLPIPTKGVHPYCQQGHAEHDTWINAADCVHPNGEGHQAYADLVLAALG